MRDIVLSCRRLVCWLILVIGISSGAVLSAEDRIGNIDISLPRAARLAIVRFPSCLDTVCAPLENDAQRGALINELSERQAIRDKLVDRANRYIESAAVYSGKIVATAFVVEGLIQFGLPPEDLYLQEKIAWLKSQRAADDKVYDASGRFLVRETAWIYRSINRFHQYYRYYGTIAHLGADLAVKMGQGESCRMRTGGDGLFASASPFAAVSFAAQSRLADFQSALRFLDNEFSLPTLADCRGRAIDEYQLSQSRYQLLATWDQYVTILHVRPAFPPNSPLGSSMFRCLIACGTSSVSSSPFFKSTESVSAPLFGLDSISSCVCRQDRREGYFVFAHTTILLI